MTLNILVSFSLLALVVTARPISDASQSIKRSLEVQNAVQAILASRIGQSSDCLTCEEDEVHVSLTTSEEQSVLLSNLDDLDAVKAIIPLRVDGTASEDEKQLYEILRKLESTSSLDDIDGDLLPSGPQDLTSPHSSDSTPSSEHAPQDVPAAAFGDVYSSSPVVVLAVSCIAALLVVFCVGAALYAYNHVNDIIVNSGLTWDLLPQLEQRLGVNDLHNIDQGGGAALPEKHKLLTDAALPPVNLDFHETLDKKVDEKLGVDEPLDVDEKFHDPPEPSLLFLDSDSDPSLQLKPDIPHIIIEGHADPDLLPLPDLPTARSTPLSTPLRTPLASPARSPSHIATQMREVQASPTLSSKPLWSLRAADAPALGLTNPPNFSPPQSRSDSPVLELPGTLFSDDALEVVTPQRPRQRTPRQPLDIAFALQLRPGLGLGADSAWLVRFLMAMFGWMTFFIGGGPRREDARRALTA